MEDAIAALEDRAAEGVASPTELAILGSFVEMMGRPGEAVGWLSSAIERALELDADEDVRAAEAAATELAALEDRAEGWSDAVTRLAARLDSNPSSPRLANLLRGMRIRDARRQGDSDHAREAVQAAGCLT